MKRTIAILLMGAAIVALLLLKRCTEPPIVVREVVHSDTVTVVRVDTVVVEKPVPVRVVEQRTDTLVVYRDRGDTVFVPVPIAQYSFRDSLYALDVSGYAVSIDRLELYPRTIYRTINTTTERIIKDKKRWGIGIQAGYGYNFGANKPGPYVGIGVQYCVVRW